MADFTLIIKAVDQASATLKRIDDTTKNLEASAKKAQAGFNDLNKALGAIVTSAVAKELFNTSKELESLQKRLSLFTGMNGSAVFKGLSYEAALLGVDVRDLAEGFIYLRRAGLDANSDSLRTITALAKSAGTTISFAGEALEDAFGQGQFKKLEQFGIVVDQIGNTFKVKFQGQVIASARSTEGVVAAVQRLTQTNEIFVRSLEKSVSISQAISNIQNTISTALTQSGLDKAIARAISAFGDLLFNSKVLEAVFGTLRPVLNGVATIIQYIADSAITKYVLGIGSAIGVTLLIVRTVGLLVTGFGLLIAPIVSATAAMLGFGTAANLVAATPIGRVLTLIAIGAIAAGTAFNLFKDNTEESKKEMEKLNQQLKKTGDDGINPLKRKIEQFVAGVLDSVPETIGIFNSLYTAYDRVLETFKKNPSMENFLLANTVFEALRTNAQKLGVVIQEDIGVATRRVGYDLQSAFEKSNTDLTALRNNLNKFREEGMTAPVYNFPTLKPGEPFRVEVTGTQDVTIKQLGEIADKTNEAARATGRYSGDVLTLQERLNVLNLELRYNAIDQKRNQELANEFFMALKAGTITVLQYQDAISKLGNVELPKTFEEVQFAVGKNIRAFDNNRALAEKLRQEVAAGTVSWKEYKEAVREIGQEHFPEYERQLSQLMPMSELLARTVEESATRMSQSFTDSFYTILKEGKFTFSAFKDFVGGILDDIAKQVIKKSFSDPIANGIAGIIGGLMKGGATQGGGFGDIFSSIGGSLGKLFGSGGGGTGLEGMSAETLALAGLASGGIVTKPTLAMVGEGGGPEAVIPLSQTTGGKYDLGMSNDSAPVVNFTLNAVDTQTGVEFLLRNKPAIIKVVQDAYDMRGRRGPVNS